MIGRIRGKLIDKRPPSLCIDVHGIGFDVLAPLSTFSQLPALNEEVMLYTEFVVREDSQTLYGFLHESDKALFQKLIKISGIGPKLALGMLSGMTPQMLCLSIKENDVAALTKLPGVGKKTAERLLVELRDKLDAWLPNANIASYSDTRLTSPTGAKAEAIAALEALGYKPKEAAKAVEKVFDEDKTAETLIKESLMGS